MKEISKAEAFAELRRHGSDGQHIDARVWREIAAPGQLFALTLASDDFLRLIWQEADFARFLTPPHESRTLRDVARRLIELGYSFDALTADIGLPREQHHPQWFTPCAEIDRAFDMDRFGLLILTPATEGEYRQSPGGIYYVFDGVHKSIVLAKRLLENTIAFRPLDVLLLVPRRD